MSKKFKVGIDLKCNIKNDCELFYLNDFKDYDFYNKLSARDAVRTRVYNVLAGKQNALNREEFGDTWNDINREIFRYVSLFTHRVYNQEHDDVELEFDDLDAQPLSVNAELISALRPATIVFDADIVAELTCRVECADSDDREAVAVGIADALKRYIRVYPSVQDLALDCLHRVIDNVDTCVPGNYRNISFVENYIDLVAFGHRLLEEFGASYAQLLPNGKIVTTSYGW